MLLGFLIAKITRAKKDNGVYRWSYNGLSLGTYIFVPMRAGEKTIKHEKGHTIQSYILGWLYLFVIGIPSIIWNACFEQYRKKNGIDYYSFYTEKWADKLGGVKR